MGLLTEADIDQALRRLFLVRFKLGLFDPPGKIPYTSIAMSDEETKKHDELALEASRQSLVLLKNDGTLPLNPKELKTVAVLGPTAEDGSALIGNYSGTPAKPVNILKGIQNKLEPLGITVLHDPAVPLVTGFRETGGPFPDGVLFTDETLTTQGLKGEIFASEKYEGAATATRSDRQLDLLWNEAQPAQNIPVKNAHVRWSGFLVPKVTGDYALSITFCGAAHLFVDNKLILGEEKPRDPGEIRTRSAGIHLEAGHKYPVRLEFHQGANDPTARIQFGWKAPGGMEKALELAKQADHIILTLGITPGLEGEEMKITADGFSHGDRTSVMLPKGQRDLLGKVAALGKPTVVILNNGSALSFDTSKANAILESWYYGQRGGDAVAEALVGEVNPGGRLPVTFYASDSDLPEFTDYSMKNRTYRYFTGKPLYAFGHGLSYTTFEYGKIEISSREASISDTLTLKVDVTNTGKIKGDEVVQVYVHESKPSMPIQSLVGFQRTAIQPGETKTVKIPVRVDSFRRWDEKEKRYVVDPGKYELRVGSSSDHILKKVSVLIY